jgi:hypothetical protein
MCSNVYRSAGPASLKPMKPVASPESEMWPNQHGTWKPGIFNPIRNSDGRLVIDDQNLELGRPHVVVSSRYLRSATAARDSRRLVQDGSP